MLKINNLSVYYDGRYALDSLSLSIEEGDFYALIGESGSGKTSLLRCIAGLTPLHQGTMELFGEPLSDHPFAVSYIPYHHGYYERLTVWEAMDFYASALNFRGIEKQALAEQCLKTCSLYDRREEFLQHLSPYQLLLYALATALLRSPKLILMDEPTRELRKSEEEEFFRLLDELCSSGIAILLTSHDISTLPSYANRIGILSEGRITYEENESTRLAEGRRVHTITMDILQGKEEAENLLRSLPEVESLASRDQKIRFRILADREGIASLLRRLITDGISVLGYKAEEENLESIYRSMSEASQEAERRKE